MSRKPAIPIILFLTASLMASLAHAQESGWGHLTGRIVVTGEVPEPKELTLESPDRKWCLDTGKPMVDQSLIVGSSGGLKNACVMMYFGRGDERRPEVHPSLAEGTASPVELNNENCQFDPQAIFVRTGQELTLRNSDAIGHNCHIVTMGNEENVSLGAGQTANVRLTTSDRVPGIVKCDIHPWMGAVILVRDEPYACFTGEDGTFRIENLPAGTWTFQFWHQRPGLLRELERDGKTAVGRRGEMEIVIQSGETTDLGELTIDVDQLSAK